MRGISSVNLRERDVGVMREVRVYGKNRKLRIQESNSYASLRRVHF